MKAIELRDYRQLRFVLFAATMALSLVASEIGSWRDSAALLDSRMLFGLALPLLAGLVLTERREALGLGIGHSRRGAVTLAIGIPLAIMAVTVLATSSEVRRFYGLHPAGLLTIVSVYATQILQVELCFRGVLLFGFLDVMPRFAAVSASVVPYALTHLDKPIAEALGSVPVGLALAAAAAWTGSVWYGWIVHLIGAISLSLLCTRF